MSNKRAAAGRPQRGRGTPTRKSGVPMTAFYVILVLITVVGVGVLLSNTQTLRDSALQDAASRQRKVVSSIPLSSLPARGDANAPVTVVEFADFQCPACGTFYSTMEPALLKDYVDTGKVKFLFHDFPLSQHANAVPAAEAARCAGDQNAFWPMHDQLYATQAQWENSTEPNVFFAGLADGLKLDRNAFAECVNSGKYTAAVKASYDASLKAGVNQTPTFTIDGQPLNANQLRGAIDAALAAKQ